MEWLFVQQAHSKVIVDIKSREGIGPLIRMRGAEICPHQPHAIHGMERELVHIYAIRHQNCQRNFEQDQEATGNPKKILDPGIEKDKSARQSDEEQKSGSRKDELIELLV